MEKEKQCCDTCKLIKSNKTCRWSNGQANGPDDWCSAWKTRTKKQGVNND